MAIANESPNESQDRFRTVNFCSEDLSTLVQKRKKIFDIFCFHKQHGNEDLDLDSAQFVKDLALDMIVLTKFNIYNVA